MLTEEEAKTKWCPFARVTLSHAGTDVNWNRIVQADNSVRQDHCNCIASECMAWRKAEFREADGSLTFYEGKGYCGLAGRP